MKAKLLQISNSQASSFDIRYEEAAVFNNPWHYHPELELTLVQESTGIRFVGDSIEPFGAGDMVLLGSHLPHFWRNDEEYYQAKSQRKARAIILRFRMDVWGSTFLQAPELQQIQHLFLRAEKGIHFDSSMVKVIEPQLMQLLHAQGAERVRLWLYIFEQLASTTQYRILSQTTFMRLHPQRDSERMQQVLQYLQTHLADPISLEEVAALVNMNVSAFCRYFKQQTNKTMVQTLQELRINYACRLLLASDLDVRQVAFECGFQNVSHFNGVFKQQMGCNPSAYRVSTKSRLLGE